MKQALNWRYATQRFDTKRQVPAKKLYELLDALRLSPSSFGLQPWKFILVKDKAVRAQLSRFAWAQPQIVEASDLIVLCVKTRMDEAYITSFIRRTAQVRGISVKELREYQNIIMGFLKSLKPQDLTKWMTQQVYIALGVLVSECAHRQIDACPIEGFDSKKFDEVLNLSKKGLHTTVLCAVGYRAKDDLSAKHQKVRFDKKEVLIVK